jgi:hypothetical protein
LVGWCLDSVVDAAGRGDGARISDSVQNEVQQWRGRYCSGSEVI